MKEPVLFQNIGKDKVIGGMVIERQKKLALSGCNHAPPLCPDGIWSGKACTKQWDISQWDGHALPSL